VPARVCSGELTLRDMPIWPSSLSIFEARWATIDVSWVSLTIESMRAQALCRDMSGIMQVVAFGVFGSEMPCKISHRA
jgi:hypothetical protein